ncbi:MAG: hypothetical protein EAX86_09335 [Candidatus Heimdallarchaeota archaeon]|nr:hypothetical protein [Candidatus Heimdallarchaeota archaeon]
MIFQSNCVEIEFFQKTPSEDSDRSGVPVYSLYYKINPWSDTYDPLPTQGDFQVAIELGVHPVLIVHLVDSYSKNSFSNYLSWFDHIETKEYNEYLYEPKTHARRAVCIKLSQSSIHMESII